MIDLKITAFPKLDETTYTDVDKSIVRLEILCIPDEGINIRGIRLDDKENDIVLFLSELDVEQSVEMAETILFYFKNLRQY